jgi:hypothetical protein
MKGNFKLLRCFVSSLTVLATLVYSPNVLIAGEKNIEKTTKDDSMTWQEKSVKYARIMSRVKWTPVADGMPIRKKGYFKKGTEYTGVPYSSVKSVGRYIGYDIFLKTFLAAVQNPYSVVYTENLSNKVTNSGCYYGKVCSSYTSYALQCGIWYPSRLHNPPYRKGVSLVGPQSAQAAKAGDIIFTPPSPGSHVEIVTEITKNNAGKVTHVRVEDSWPKTTRNNNRSAGNFNGHISSHGRKLYRITNLDVWRANNKAESFLFPNYTEDSKKTVINRVLLLDRGDWVPYQKGQIVKINIMDKDDQGVKKLVIKKGDTVVEEIEVTDKGVIERSFSTCGDYTAHCVMKDGSLSQACGFSVCDLDFNISVPEVKLGESWEIKFSSDNMKIIIIYLASDTNSYSAYNLFVNDEDRKKGKVTIPADLIKDTGNLQIWLMGENKYGRLKKRYDIIIKK